MDNNQNNQPVQQEGSNGLAVAALVLGIMSIVFAFLFVWIGLITGIVGIILAVQSRKNPAKKGMGTAGLVCSIIGLALSGLMIACALCVLGTIGSAIADLGV